MATIIPESATFVKSVRLLKCQPVLNHPENLVTNGDFSNGTDGWTWTPNLSGVEPCRYVYLPLVIKSGGAASEADREITRALSSIANHSPVACPQAYAHPNGAGNYIVPWQDIPNPLTGTYTLTGWILTSGGLQSAWIQADNGDFNTRHCRSTPTNTPSWQQFGCSFSLNTPGAIHVGLVASNASGTAGGWVKWDSISLIRQSRVNISTYDLAQYLGRIDGTNGPVYQLTSSMGVETAQIQYANDVWQGKPGFYQVKNTNWEELAYGDTNIRRLRDTSPGQDGTGRDRWYGLYAGCPGACSLGAIWAPRYMKVGDTYWRSDTTVKFYYKDNCEQAADYPEQSGIKLEATYPSLNIGGYVLNDVAWLRSYRDANYTQPWEDYYYAKGVGLVKFQAYNEQGQVVFESHFTGYNGSPPTRQTICNP